MTLRDKSLLIFDLDGTLIDSVPDLCQAVNLTLQDFSLPTFEEKQVRNWVGNGAKLLITRALAAAYPLNLELTHTHTEPVSVEQALGQFFVHYREHTCEKTQAYVGVNEGLKALKNANFTLAIATNKPYQFVPTILQNLGWETYFTLVLGGDSLPQKKPDPTPLLHICEKLHCLPEQSYMIGDSKNDILAGRNADIDTLGVSYGYNYGEALSLQQPTHMFDSFSDLVDYLLR